MKNCRGSGWHCLPSQVDFYMQQGVSVGQITWVVLSWAVVKLKVSLCESCFGYGSPQLWETLTESLGTFVPSSGFWLTVWIFSKHEDAESSVQPLSCSLLLRFASFLSCDPYKSATTGEEGSANWGAPFSVPPFPSGCWLESFFLCRPVRLPKVLLSFSASQPWMAEETPSAWREKAGRNVWLTSVHFPSLPDLSRKSWLHWELSSPANQVVSLCLTRLF